jgi:hypothetical protein
MDLWDCAMYCVAKRAGWIIGALLILSGLVLVRPQAADLKGPPAPEGYLDIEIKEAAETAGSDDWRTNARREAQLAVDPAAQFRKAAEAAVQAVARGELADETAAAAIAADVALKANKKMYEELTALKETPAPVEAAAKEAVSKAEEAKTIAELAAQKEDGDQTLSRQAATAAFYAEHAISKTIKAIIEADHWRGKAMDIAEAAEEPAGRVIEAAKDPVQAAELKEAAKSALEANAGVYEELNKLRGTPEEVLRAAKNAVGRAEKVDKAAQEAQNLELIRKDAEAALEAVKKTIEIIKISRNAEAVNEYRRTTTTTKVFIDGLLLQELQTGERRSVGHRVAAGKKKVRVERRGELPPELQERHAEFKGSDWVTKAASETVEIAAGGVHELKLDLVEQTGKLIIINEWQKTVKLDGGNVTRGSHTKDVLLGPHLIQVTIKEKMGEKEEETISKSIEVCRDHVLKIRIAKANGGIEMINGLASCKGIWPIATHKDCPTGGAENFHYFQSCAFGVPWGKSRKEIQDTFGLSHHREGWGPLVYKHPDKDYRVAYFIGPEGLDRVDVVGTGAPMVSDLVSGVATHGELMRELGSTAGVTKPIIHRQENGCGRGVQFELKGFSFLVVCRPEQPPQPPHDQDSDGRVRCTSPLLCKNWRVTKR